ncbi:MAG: TonB-dependent receptor [Pseudomonadota bacterium]
MARTRSHMLPALILVILLTPMTAISQESESDIDEIVVRGQKIERSLFETPESVAVLTADEINRRSLQTLEDVYNQTANAASLFNNENFSIRGVSSNSSSTTGGAGELATYFIDGVAITGFAKRFVPMDMWDVPQVEILRGPQSTNLGRNAMMGAVMVSTGQPDLDEFEAALRIGGGNPGRYEAAGLINIPISDTVALRFSGDYLSTDGFIKNETLGQDDFDARENYTFRAKLLWAPTDDLDFTLGFQALQSERGQNLTRFDLTSAGDRVALGNLVDRENLDGQLATLHANWRLTDQITLRSITSYLNTDYDRFDDDDQGPDGGTAFRGREAFDRNWAEELRLDYVSDTLSGTVGIYYIDVEVENNTTGLVNIQPGLLGVPDILLPFYPPVISVNINGPALSQTENASIFTEWDWQFEERWSVQAGLRYETEDQSNRAGSANTLDASTPLPDPDVAGDQAEALFGPAVGAQVRAGVAQVNGLLLSFIAPTNEVTEPDFDAVLGKLGIAYDVSDNLRLAATFSQGYRAGGAQITLVGTQSDYDPERLNNFELSLRSRLLDGRASFNANVYYGLWEDQQVTLGLDGNLLNTIIDNAGESTIYGGEVEFRYEPNSSWLTYATLGYANNTFDEFDSIDGDLAGNNFAFSPEWTAAVGGTYYFGDYYVGGNVTYQGESFSDVQNTQRLDAFALLNMQLGWQNDRYAVGFYGKNLTDELYLTSEGPGLIPGSIIGRVGEPREYGVEVTAFF